MAGEEPLGREYLLHEEIGRGASAVVRRATSRHGGPPLAAKLLHATYAGDRRVRNLILREEAALRDLRHESIVALHDLVVEGGRIALLTEYVDGPNLRRHLTARGGRLSTGEAGAIGARVAAALAAAHAHGVVHLDLKPENVLVTPNAVKITDFGVAALLSDAHPTATGGTPGYIAPELITGGAATAAADVYALGILLTEMVTGTIPEGPPGPDAPPLIHHCLAPDPRDRPSARVVAAQLRAAVGATPPAPAHAPNQTRHAPNQTRSAPNQTRHAPNETRLDTAHTDTTTQVPGSRWRPGRDRRDENAEPVTSRLTELLPDVMAPILRWSGLTAAVSATVAVAVSVVVGVTVYVGGSDAVDRALPPPAAVSASPAVTVKAAPVAVDRTRATYAAHLPDGAGTLYLALRDGVAIAYLCDGDRVEAWFRGTVTRGAFHLTGRHGTLDGTFTGANATGEVVAEGRALGFALPAVRKPSGLYRASARLRDAEVKGGWIVLPDGRQVGVVTVAGVPRPAPPLDTAARTAALDGAPVAATAIDIDSGSGF